jgi:glycosyltransferase involved in cell wall biosynthesis
MPTAINFDGHVDDFNHPLGIDVATREFIRAFFRYSSQKEFPCVCPDKKALDMFQVYASNEGIKPKNIFGVNQNDAVTLERVGHLFRYDPAILKFVWSRRYCGQKRYSISGLVHAGSTGNVMEIIGQYVTAPTQSWDALICPSNSIKLAVLNVIEHWQTYLRERTGSTFKCPVQLPVIPIGIDTDYFERIATAKKYKEQRKILKIRKDEIVVLFAGRLNFIGKANPLALMLGIERAAILTNKPVRLLFYGYFFDDHNQKAFKEAANKLCHSVNVSFINHGEKKYPDGFWAGADIFCSLADNIQESFGLTPIEAMASSLPVVVSDWDGYRDTIRNEIDGFTVPTLAPNKGLGEDLAYKFFSGQDSYSDYISAAQQSTSVNLDSLVEALKRLIENPSLRKKMGAAGKERARSKYAWSKIIAEYEELFSELTKRRLSDQENTPKSKGVPFHPSHPDPFDMFESFSSQVFSEQGKIEILTTNWPDVINLMSLKVSLIYPESLIPLEKMPDLLGHLEPGLKIPIQTLLEKTPSLNPTHTMLTLAWLTKLGICRYHE